MLEVITSDLPPSVTSYMRVRDRRLEGLVLPSGRGPAAMLCEARFQVRTYMQRVLGIPVDPDEPCEITPADLEPGVAFISDVGTPRIYLRHGVTEAEMCEALRHGVADALARPVDYYVIGGLRMHGGRDRVESLLMSA